MRLTVWAKPFPHRVAVPGVFKGAGITQRVSPGPHMAGHIHPVCSMVPLYGLAELIRAPTL